MSKRRGKTHRAARPGLSPQEARPPEVDLRDTLARADELTEQDQPQAAVELLEPLLERYPRTAAVHFLLGLAYAMTGDLWRSLARYERAMELGRNPEFWRPLAALYLQLDMNGHALHAFRQVLLYGLAGDETDQVRAIVAFLEPKRRELARLLRIPEAQVEKGLRYLEDGNRALHMGDYATCISANRQAIRVLGDWPPPHNNLSLALFFEGHPDEAIATARQVLAQDPANIQALSNACRFLAWTGHPEEARGLWLRLRTLTPQNPPDCIKMAEAAAILDEHQAVHDLLEWLEKSDGVELLTGSVRQHAQFLLAVAAANLGKRSARRRLQALQDSLPRVGELLQALRAGQPGPGWADHFPYFRSSELMPLQHLEELIELIGRQDNMPDWRYHNLMARFAARFPQAILVGEKLIWEEAQPEAGILILGELGTPAAYAALRGFGLSQAGDDETRMEALYRLNEAGQIAPDDVLRVWNKGEWREIQLRMYEIAEGPESAHTPQVARLLDQGDDALEQGDFEKAERLFRRALELEPRAQDAYNNLGTVYAQRGESAQAKAMYRAALEIDPLYVYARCNLAFCLLDDDDVDGAVAMLAPLAEVARFRPQEMAFYSYAQARIAAHQEEYDVARHALETALEINPDYQQARDLLARLDDVSRIRSNFESFLAARRGEQLRKRARLQAGLSLPNPSLAEAFSHYSKEMLSGMAVVVMPYGGWSALRKADLLNKIVETLGDAGSVGRIVAELKDQERTALHEILARDGHMSWQDFAVYGDDLEESPYWQWHAPQSAMGRLRQRGLLVEATVEGRLVVAVPLELRPLLAATIG